MSEPNHPEEQPIEEVDVDFEKIPETETEVFEEEEPWCDGDPDPKGLGYDNRDGGNF